MSRSKRAKMTTGSGSENDPFTIKHSAIRHYPTLQVYLMGKWWNVHQKFNNLYVLHMQHKIYITFPLN
jgi:hypothetical protein